MTKAIIPFNASCVVSAQSNSNFQSNKLIEKRNALLNELRCIPGIVEIANTLKSDEVHKIVSFPDGGKLYKDAAGNFKGVFYKDGKILEHTKFQAIRPSIIKAATAIGSQVLLISISMQLNRIEKSINKVFKEFHNDRIAEINAGINIYNQAINSNSSETQLILLGNAISVLNTGIEKSLKSLKQQIADAPDTKIGFFDNWGSDKSAASLESFRLAEESFQTCLVGIQTLAECYATISEPQIAAVALRTYINKINSCEIELAAQKSRLVPYTSGEFPEKPWNYYLENRESFDAKIIDCENLSNNQFESIEIEIKPDELKEIGNGNLY